METGRLRQDLSPEDSENGLYGDEIMARLQEDRKIKSRRRLNFTVGIIIVLFAITGIAFSIFSGISLISRQSEKRTKELYNSYNSFLIPLAAADAAAFDDLSSAPMNRLIEISVWSIISGGLDPSKYDYSTGELGIPAAEVEAAFSRYFGSLVEIEHQSVEGYGYEFEYDGQDKIYYLPLTTILPLYTPRTLSVETRAGLTIVTCALINTNAWMQDSESGDMLTPEPDKYIKVTFREFAGASYISAIQQTGKPELAVPAVNAQQESAENSSSQSALS